MECAKYVDERVLEAYGELGVAPAFREHFAGCAICRADVEEMRDIAAEYRAASVERLPERVRRRVIVPRWARSRVIDFALPALAAAVLVALLLIPVLSPKPPEPTKTPPPTKVADNPVEHAGLGIALSIDERIGLARREIVEWDAPETRVDYDLRMLHRDVEFLQLTTDDM